MITQILIIVVLVWSLCPFLPVLPFPYPWFYAVCALCFIVGRKYKIALYCGLVSASLATGIAQLSFIGYQQLPAALEDQLWRGEIKVQQIRLAATGGYAQVQAKIIATEGEPSDVSYNFDGKIISLGWPNATQLLPGQHWIISVKLRRVQGLLNTAGVNFTALNLSQGITLQGQVKATPTPVAIAASLGTINSLQNYFKHVLAATNAPEYARFYSALALGDTRDLTQQDWQILQKTGTIHLMAISGFQIGLMASVGFWFGIFCAKPLSIALIRLPTLQHWPSRFCPVFFSILFASFYTYLANFSLPAERAWVACILLNGAWLLQLRASLLQLWLLCCVLALLFHPLAPLNTGFWLSYCAVAALLYLGGKKSRGKWLNQTLEAQWVITIALTLPQLALNITLSTSGFVANVCVGPWISIVITPLVFILLGLSLIMDVSNGFFEVDHGYFIAWWLLEAISKVPATLWWPSHKLTGLDYLLAALGSILLLIPRSLGFFYLGCILIWISLFCPRQKDQLVQLHIFDVGQGLAVLIKTAHHTILFDAGPSFSSRFDAGTHILTPYFLNQGIHAIDVFISRDSAEHAGGLRGLTSLDWGVLTSGEPLAQYPQALRCEAGQAGNWDYIYWEVITPVSGTEDYSRSCALKLTIGSRHIYLFGDISVAQQRALVQDGSVNNEPVNKEPICCAYILLAPGQGSKNQYVAALAKQLKPAYTVFSNAAHNRYQHPHPWVLKQYNDLDSRTLLTAQTGALTWRWQNAQAEPELISQWPRQQRYWYPVHATGNLEQHSTSE